MSFRWEAKLSKSWFRFRFRVLSRSNIYWTLATCSIAYTVATYIVWRTEFLFTLFAVFYLACFWIYCTKFSSRVISMTFWWLRFSTGWFQFLLQFYVRSLRHWHKILQFWLIRCVPVNFFEAFEGTIAWFLFLDHFSCSSNLLFDWLRMIIVHRNK